MYRQFFIISIILVSLIAAKNCIADNSLLIATTTSTDNTGLLNKLAPQYKKDTNIELKWTAVGTGKALALGKNCDVSVLLVHAPNAEKQFITAGYGTQRTPIMYNDFVLIGPKSDPAHSKNLPASKALAKIAKQKNIFISRGDNSGTYKKEMQLWKIANYSPPAKSNWYLQSGQGMLATIEIATEKNGYTLADRGTYIKYSAMHDNKPALIILSQGNKILRNQYSVIIVNPKHCSNVQYNKALQFKNWIASKKTQNIINNYKLLGEKLFSANAKNRL